MASSLTFLKYYLRTALSSKPLWGWAIGFMVFWLVMGVVEALSSPSTRFILPEAKLGYVGAWYATVTVIGLGSAAVGLCRDLAFSSVAARYLTKYSKLSSSKLFGSLVAGFVVVCLVISLVLLAIAIPMYSAALGINALPKNVAGVLATSIALGTLLYALSAALVFGAIALRSAKGMYFVSYVPLIVSLGLALSQVYANLGWAIVISPFNAASTLIFSYFTGTAPRLTSFAGWSLSAPTLPTYLLWVSLVGWTLGLSAIAIALLRIQRGVGIEELRLV